jgi:hypothetical protein
MQTDVTNSGSHEYRCCIVGWCNIGEMKNQQRLSKYQDMVDENETEQGELVPK